MSISLQTVSSMFDYGLDALLAHVLKCVYYSLVIVILGTV